jgi:peptidoglycan hydrolase CwlO-like protein
MWGSAAVSAGRPARLWLRTLCAALLATLIGQCLPPALAQSPNYAQLTQTTVSQLIAAVDLYRSNRSTEAQAVLRNLGAGLEQLKGITDHYRELANAEHARCMSRVVELEQRTSDLYQEQQKVAATLSSLEAEIASTTAKMQVADQEVQRISAGMRDAAGKLQERERKLKELESWWWVPGYGQYLAVRTLAEKDIETYNSLANGLRDQSVLIHDQQQALGAAREAQQRLSADRGTSQQTLNSLQQVRQEAEQDLGRLKRSATVLTDAYVLWTKAGDLLRQTAQDQLGSLEMIETLLQRPSAAPDFADAAGDYAGDLQTTLRLFAQSVDNGSNFLTDPNALCGGPPRDPNAVKVSQPCSMVAQITQYYEIVDPATCSFRYLNPPGCPPFPVEISVSDANVAAARASGAWVRAPSENWVGRNRCRAIATIYYGKVTGADACEAVCMSDSACQFWTYNERNGMMPNSQQECWGGRGAAAPNRGSWGGFVSGGRK